MAAAAVVKEREAGQSQCQPHMRPRRPRKLLRLQEVEMTSLLQGAIRAIQRGRKQQGQ